jgi:fructose/tagatose bisphosphate aldolase
LGAVFGHESGPLPSYEELFTTGRGFTSPQDAERFVAETGVDWLSVAAGSVHGPLSSLVEKVEARLNLEHLDRVHNAAKIPLVLHGGSGIPKRYILEGTRRGIAKINIATVLRRAYEKAALVSAEAARQTVYEMTKAILTDELELAGTRSLVHAEG